MNSKSPYHFDYLCIECLLLNNYFLLLQHVHELLLSNQFFLFFFLLLPCRQLFFRRHQFLLLAHDCQTFLLYSLSFLLQSIPKTNKSTVYFSNISYNFHFFTYSFSSIALSSAIFSICCCNSKMISCISASLSRRLFFSLKILQ